MRIPFFPQKDFADITFEDVRRFCSSDRRENAMLDYKEDLSPTLSKTVCAMANGSGGVMIVGVAEDGNGCPRQPCAGRTGRGDGDIAKIENYLATDIWPPVIFHADVYGNEDADRHFIIVNVPSSAIGPHRMLSDNTVPFRVAQRSVSRPSDKASKEGNADPEKIFDMMKKREESKKKIFEIVEGSTTRAYRVIGSVLPNVIGLRPFIQIIGFLPVTDKPIFPYRLTSDISSFKTHYDGGFSHPYERYRFNSINEGVYGMHSSSERKQFSYLEICSLGLINAVESIGNEAGYTLGEIVSILSLFLDLTYKAFSDIGQYSGAINIEMRLQNVQGQTARLPNGDTCASTDPVVHLEEKLIPIEHLNSDRPGTVTEIISRLCWSVGCKSDLTAEIRTMAESHKKTP